MKKIFLTTIVASFALTACETTSSRPYKASTDNIIAFQTSFAKSGNKVQVGDFDTAEGVKTDMTCRAMGALDVSPGKNAVVFIRDALKEELFEAGAYSADSDTVIRGTVTELDANSWGTGKWKVGLNLASDNLPDGLDVSTEYEFKTSYSAIKACQNVVDAYTPTVQQLISTAIQHPDFGKLVK